MNHLKKFLVFLLCAVLVLSLATVALAETEAAPTEPQTAGNGGTSITTWVLLGVAALVFGMGSALANMRKK